MLRFEGLYFAPDGTPLLNNVSGIINAGDKIALIGRSGSGKSLLLQALADLLSAVGDIWLLGRHITDIPPTTYRRQVALIGQEPSLSEGTVQDNLCLPFGFACHKNKTFNQAFHLHALATLGKSPDFLTKTTDVLSGGEKQLVNFLRSLQFDPDVLLLDEPTAALDPDTAHRLIQLVLAWHSPNKAFVWVTHTHEHLTYLQGTLWVMADGQLQEKSS